MRNGKLANMSKLISSYGHLSKPKHVNKRLLPFYFTFCCSFACGFSDGQPRIKVDQKNQKKDCASYKEVKDIRLRPGPVLSPFLHCLRYTDHCGKRWGHPQNRQYITYCATLLEEDQTTATGNRNRKFGWVGRIVPGICSRTDRQTYIQTHSSKFRDPTFQVGSFVDLNCPTTPKSGPEYRFWCQQMTVHDIL